MKQQTWIKSSYSGGSGGNCIEVNDSQHAVMVRDTQDRTGPILRFTPGAWKAFADQVKGKRSLANLRPTRKEGSHVL